VSPPAAPAPSPLRCWIGFAAFYVAAFAVLGVYMQYFPGWLRAAGGLSEGQVSLVLAAQTIARTFAGPLWSQRVDRTGEARGVLVLLSIGSAGAFVLFGVSHELSVLWGASFLFGCLCSPMYPIVDGAAMHTANVQGFAFGRLRMVGSVSFLVTILVVGALLDAHGLEIVFPVLLGGMIAMASSSFALPRQVEANATPQHTDVRWSSLLASRPLVLLLVAGALIQGSHATYYNLSTMHWVDHGISKTVAGALWAEGILAEIVLFYLASRTVDRLRPTTLLMLGACAAVVRWCVVASTTSLPWLFATGWLHALTFAGTYLGCLRALERRVPAHQRATAQGLLGAATSGIGMVVGGLLGGFVYERWAGRAFLTMAAFAAIGFMLAWRLRRQADAASRQPPHSATTRPA